MKLLFAIFVLFWIGQTVDSASTRLKAIPPIILVPGVGSSQLEGKLFKTKANGGNNCFLKVDEWIDIFLVPQLIAGNPQCFAEDISLHFNRWTKTTSNALGVEIRALDFGNTTGVEYISSYHADFTEYFYDLVQHLVDTFGYERGISIHGAPYDFRKAPNEMQSYFKKFTKLVEDSYRNNGNTPVIIIGHSMGCLVTLYFLNHQKQSWKDKYIRSFISTSGPYGGSVKTLRLLASGDNLGNPQLNATALRDPERSMTSSAFLMPYKGPTFWNDSEILVYGPKRNYAVKDYGQFFKDINFTIGIEMREVVEPLIKKLEPPNVEVHCVYSSSVPTIASLYYLNWTIPDHAIMGDGDGSVNIRSLLGCNRWKGTNSKPFDEYNIQGSNPPNHDTIISDPNYFAYIDNIINT